MADIIPSFYCFSLKKYLYLRKRIVMKRLRENYSTIHYLKKNFPFFSPIYSILSKTFSHLRQPQLKNLTALILTFFHHSSFSIYDLAKSFPSNTSQKHKHKALIRSLNNIPLNDDFWKAYIRLIFALPGFRIRKRKYISILLDTTTLKDDFWILAACISFEGRSIPIYLKMWSGVNEPYDYWERVIKFMKKLREFLPDKYSYIVVADRGFRGEQLPNWCKKLKIDYIIRIHDDYHVRLKNGKEWQQISLFSKGLYTCSEIGKKTQMEGNIVVSELIDVDKIEATGKKKDDVNKKKTKWYLQTNLSNSELVIDTYYKRMQIEESFKDLKHVLHWEKYTKNVPKKEYIEKCVTISCLSYAIQMSLGNYEKVSEKEEERSSLLSRWRNLMNRGIEFTSKIMKIFIAVVSVNIWRIEQIFY